MIRCGRLSAALTNGRADASTVHQATSQVWLYFRGWLARAAVIEAVWLDKQQAPQREIERQNWEDEQFRAQQDKARLVNKPGFRP